MERAFQESKGESYPVKDTWDTVLSDGLRKNKKELFEKYVQLVNVKFPRARALIPTCDTNEPLAITFSDLREQVEYLLMLNCTTSGIKDQINSLGS